MREFFMPSNPNKNLRNPKTGIFAGLAIYTIRKSMCNSSYILKYYIFAHIWHRWKFITYFGLASYVSFTIIFCCDMIESGVQILSREVLILCSVSGVIALVVLQSACHFWWSYCRPASVQLSSWLVKFIFVELSFNLHCQE